MPRRPRSPYPAEFRERIIDLARSGRTPQELAKDFELSAKTIRSWVAQAARAAGEAQIAVNARSARAVDVVAFAASAGGLGAIHEVLQNLPQGFPVPLVAMLHLPPGFALDGMLGRLPMGVDWATTGSALQPGRLLICPPRSFVQILPDGTCTVSPCEGGAAERPIDRLLVSIARSFGERAIGVVLTGMGDDAAAGASELRRAGGCVLVQSAATAEHPSMPRASIVAGAATMVLPLAELGGVIGALVAGKSRPQRRAEVESIRQVFGDRGEVAARARERDWSATPLGAVTSWSDELRVIARTILESTHPAAVWWGPDLIQIYNDAWRPFLGVRKHPQALGGRARETWPEIWPEIGPMVERVRAHGDPVGREDYPLLIEREDYTEEVFVTFSFTPIRDAAGAIVGVLNSVWETTRNVVTERRLKGLRDLVTGIGDATGPRDACERAAKALASVPEDVPFALLYLNAGDFQAVLAGAAGVEPDAQAAPRFVPLSVDALPWPLARVLAKSPASNQTHVRVNDLAQRCPDLPPIVSTRGGSHVPPSSALMLPLRSASAEKPLGVVVLGLNPYRPYDDTYRRFIDLMVGHIAVAIAQAGGRERGRERSGRLAELDRAKTEFFANVSHEFRTPLTLLLAPLEELLLHRDLLPARFGEELDTATRNARRLMTLVTNLLDFSQVESSRPRARLAPHDLGALTVDIVSHFRSAVEAAGLRLRVDVAATLPAVPVDPEMWMKIVSNLLSNAFKFTFAGEISVVLNALRLHAELVVSDTGVGVPEHELPNLFKRFHRVRGTRARTAEGAGIGLSLVQDLVTRMGGQLQVRSKLGAGTTFTIWMPYKSFREAGEVPDAEVAAPEPTAAVVLAKEASRWLSNEPSAVAGVALDLLGPPPAALRVEALQSARERIVVIDDNADMRDFLRRLLGSHWDVETASDAEAGWAAVRGQRPAAIVMDVMLPGVDGFELLKRVRADTHLRRTPVILLTALAGEAAAIEGLEAGADDYVAKPFSSRELVARVRTVIERARADVAMCESEALLGAVLQALPQGVGVLDPTGTTLLSNQRFRRFLPSAVIPSHDPDHAHRWSARSPNGEPLPPQQYPGARALRGERVVPGIEMLLREDDGTELWTEVSAAPIKNSDGTVKVAITVINDIDRLKRSAEALQLSEARHAYRVRLGDALRSLVDPNEIMATASRALGELLGASRVAFFDVRSDHYVVEREYLDNAISIAGRHPVAGFGPAALLGYRAGRTLIQSDVRDDLTLSADEHAAYEAVQVRAYVSVPIVRNGEFIFGLACHMREQRKWTPEEIALVEETAERTWTAVDRARVEAALRESEQRFRLFVTASSAVVYRMSADWSQLLALQGKDFLADTNDPTRTWLEEYIPDSDKAFVQGAIAAAVRNRTTFELEHHVIQADGTVGWVFSRAIPLMNDRGEVVEWFGAATDITERKRTDEGQQFS